MVETCNATLSCSRRRPRAPIVHTEHFSEKKKLLIGKKWNFEKIYLFRNRVRFRQSFFQMSQTDLDVVERLTTFHDTWKNGNYIDRAN